MSTDICLWAEEGQGEDEAEYVPQKAESVKHEEEGSFYSVRCYVNDSCKNRNIGIVTSNVKCKFI